MGCTYLVFLWLLSLISLTSQSRILFIVPTPSVSHALPVFRILEELLSRGHHITHITADPMPTNHENYTLVDLSESYKIPRGYNASEAADSTPIIRAQMYNGIGKAFCNEDYNSPKLQEWLKHKYQFDLAVIERLPYQCFYGLLYNADYPPLVGLVTLPTMSPVHYVIGNPTNPAYLTDTFVSYSDHMDFWERLWNTYYHLELLHYWFYTVMPEHEAIMRHYLGPEPKSVYEVERNFSMLLVAVHFSGDYPRPQLPNIIEITGLHVKNTTKPLPNDMKEFLDGAKHGVIYFSLGSNVRSCTMPDHKKQAFLDAFRELPQRVIWKFEDESMNNVPDNVMVRQWMPQPAILAHPNVKLYIMQGGLQSLNEAAYRAIPLVAIPFFSDQEHNVGVIVTKCIGVRLRHKHITKETVLSSIRTVLGDSKYQENMNRYSALFREHQASSLDTAVWWLEYMIRHNGAPHMRSAALDLHWWQLLLLDVIGFVLLVAAAAVTLLYFSLRWLASALVRPKVRKEKKQ